MRIQFKTSLTATLLSMASLTSVAAEQPGWQPLFNGENLEGWSSRYVTSGVEGKTADAFFKAGNGQIHVYPEEKHGSKQPFAVLLTDAEYGDYALTLEYKWGEAKFHPRMDKLKDAGLLYHAHGFSKQFGWPLSMEYQIQDTDTGNSYGIGTHYGATVNGKWQEKGDFKRIVGILHDHMFEVDGWNKVELLVRGDKSIHKVNGKEVIRISNFKQWDSLTQQWLPLVRGQIVLQAEGAEVFYRNIMIRPLTDADPI